MAANRGLPRDSLVCGTTPRAGRCDRGSQVLVHDLWEEREALAWNCPMDVHLGLVDPNTPNFPEAENLPIP